MAGGSWQPPDPLFCEWLAGLIDGGGHLRMGGDRYPELEITTGLEDLPLLRLLRSRLAMGSVRLRKSTKGYSYRVSNRRDLVRLVACINGRCRHSRRAEQLALVCRSLGIPFRAAPPPTADSGWFAGFFDANGDLCLNHSRWDSADCPHLRVVVVNRSRVDVEPFLHCFGGSIHYSRAGNGSFHWVVQDRAGVERLLSYFRRVPFRSRKAQRFHLVEDYYRLRQLKAHRPDSPHAAAWARHLRRWEGKLKIESSPPTGAPSADFGKPPGNLLHTTTAAAAVTELRHPGPLRRRPRSPPSASGPGLSPRRTALVPAFGGAGALGGLRVGA